MSLLPKRPQAMWFILLLLRTPAQSPLNILSTYQINQRIIAGMSSGLSRWIPHLTLAPMASPRQVKAKPRRPALSAQAHLVLHTTHIIQPVSTPLAMAMGPLIARGHSLSIQVAAAVFLRTCNLPGGLLLSMWLVCKVTLL